jgi:hypothetical protein
VAGAPVPPGFSAALAAALCRVTMTRRSSPFASMRPAPCSSSFITSSGCKHGPFNKTKRPTPDKSAEQAAAFLLNALDRHATDIINMAAGKNWRETQFDAFPVVAREVLLFELYLASRSAKPSSDDNASFMEELLDVVAERAPKVMRPRFHDEYAARQLFYARFPDLKPHDGQSYEGTLFWEFSKLILKVTDQKPEAAKMQGMHVICSDLLREIDEGFEQLGIRRPSR